MELTIQQKIGAWKCLAHLMKTHPNQYHGMCGYIWGDDYHTTFEQREYLLTEIKKSLHNKGKSNVEFLYTEGETKPRFKYINRKIKQLENEKTNCR